MPILTGKEKATTEYLSAFENIQKFDAISCQFAIHYACESEETFRSFAKNIQKYGKNTFFGTCMDGQSVYSLLVGKDNYMIGSEKQVCGKFGKQYTDTDTWKDEFGMAVLVDLESFDKPQIEYLVPFDRVVSIMKEVGYDLVESKMFSELYSQQTGISLTAEQQVFSFLNRTFLFVKGEVAVPEPVPETEVVAEPVVDEKEVVVEEPKKKTRKLKKGGYEGPPPVLFFEPSETGGEFRNFSNMSQHPVQIDGEKYPTVEHYYQWRKAKLFKDDESADKIQKAKTPKAAKALGKKVKDFVDEEWKKNRLEFMKTGVHAKFIQHPELRKQLMETGDRIIGEADPRDTYWGIGTKMDSDRASDPSKWRARNFGNHLGNLLMDLRRKFNDESL
jgi:hypothetical protein